MKIIYFLVFFSNAEAKKHIYCRTSTIEQNLIFFATVGLKRKCFFSFSQTCEISQNCASVEENSRNFDFAKMKKFCEFEISWIFYLTVTVTVKMEFSNSKYKNLRESLKFNKPYHHLQSVIQVHEKIVNFK